MRKMTVTDVEKGIQLDSVRPDYLRDYWFGSDDVTGFYIPLLCFHLEENNPVLLEIIGEEEWEETCVFQALVRGWSDEKDGELVPEFRWLKYFSDERDGYIEMDSDVKDAILKAIIEQCPKACGRSMEELLIDCRNSECSEE